MPAYPHLIAVVDPQTKHRFKATARAMQITESKLLGCLVDKLLQTPGIDTLSSAASDDGPKKNAIRVRLTDYEHDELKRLASVKGMTRSTYLSALFRTHLKQEPRFTTDELTALRQATRELSQLGKNVNQIARLLNLSMDESERLQAIDLKKMNALIDSQRLAIKELLHANLTSWDLLHDAQTS